MSLVPIGSQFAQRAAAIVQALKETAYQHTTDIWPDSGIFNCDCSGFVSYVVSTLAPRHYALIPREPQEDRPRAFMYLNFFSTLGPAQTPWTRVPTLHGAQPGDILAWRFPQIEPGYDTGHVLFVAGQPTPTPQSSVVELKVFDSAAIPHFDDSRGTGPGQFATGVGSGTIRFQVDSSGAPTAFLFASGDHFVSLPIALARAGPFSP